MLDDRHYMRPEYGAAKRWHASPTIVLLLINLAVFVFQNIDRVYLHSGFERHLALSAGGLREGHVWQLLTFQFLHVDSLHFLLNSLMLYVFGRVIEDTLGDGRFWEIYFLSGTTGGVFQGLLGLAFPVHFGLPTLGASAGVSGLLATFCLIHRDETLRVFFVLPVRARNVLIASMAVATFFILVPAETGVAHAAHLGGMVAAVGYFHWILRSERRLFNWRSYSGSNPEAVSVARPAVGIRFGVNRAPAEQPENLPPDEFISQEVDPILDKISAHGIHSLTDRERKILERARAKMARR